MGNFETILYEEHDGVATVTLNRPEVLNAFNQRMQDELRQLWRSLRSDDDVRAVILTGSGERAFCSGIDRKESIEEGYLPREKTGAPRSERVSKAGRLSTPYMFNDPGSDLNPHPGSDCGTDARPNLDAAAWRASSISPAGRRSSTHGTVDAGR